MNLLYEDMHDTTYDDLQTHTKQIENPSISFDEYIANIKRGMGEGKGDNNPNPNPNPNPDAHRGYLSNSLASPKADPHNKGILIQKLGLEVQGPHTLNPSDY